MILLVDGTQNFIRCYTTFSTCTANGDPCGGYYGFLCSLASFVSVVQPTQVIVAFDAPGGSLRRKKIYKEYKEGRKPPRLNRKFDIGDAREKNNKKAQQQYLSAYLKDLPVSTVCVNNIEADDVIAYLCLKNADKRKVIVSSDQDFQQLLDANTMIYKPSKKQFYTSKNLVEESKIFPVNFALARAFTGDSSDNIKGVPGIGLKRLTSLLPAFTLPEPITTQQAFTFCEQLEPKKSDLFLQYKDRVTDNYSIMQLKDPMISMASINTINSSIRQNPAMNSTAFRLKLMRDGLNLGDRFLCTFLKLSLAGKTINV